MERIEVSWKRERKRKGKNQRNKWKNWERYTVLQGSTLQLLIFESQLFYLEKVLGDISWKLETTVSNGCTHSCHLGSNGTIVLLTFGDIQVN